MNEPIPELTMRQLYAKLWPGVADSFVDKRFQSRWRKEMPDGYRPVAEPFFYHEKELLLSHARSLEGLAAPASLGQGPKDFVFYNENGGVATATRIWPE
jgi:hypothetical protein